MKFLINILIHEKQTCEFTILSNLEFFESSLFIKIRVFIQGQLRVTIFITILILK